MPYGEERAPVDYEGVGVKGKQYITFRECREYGYVQPIQKVMRVLEPHKLHTLRSSDMTGRRFIRDGTRGTNTDLEVEIWKVEKILFLRLTEEFCKADLATNNPPVTRSYKHDLYGVLKTLMGQHFPSVFYINYLRPVIKSRQVSLDGEILGRKVEL